jgi:hypothetical protein
MGDTLSPFCRVHPDGKGTIQCFARIDDLFRDAAGFASQFVGSFQHRYAGHEISSILVTLGEGLFYPE